MKNCLYVVGGLVLLASIGGCFASGPEIKIIDAVFFMGGFIIAAVCISGGAVVSAIEGPDDPPDNRRSKAQTKPSAF